MSAHSPEGRVPFSNGTEVDMFRERRCDNCKHDDPEGGGCDEFALGVGMGEWPDLLVEVPIDAANPLGIECSQFEARDASPLPASLEAVRESFRPPHARVVMNPDAQGSYNE